MAITNDESCWLSILYNFHKSLSTSSMFQTSTTWFAVLIHVKYKNTLSPSQAYAQCRLLFSQYTIFVVSTGLCNCRCGCRVCHKALDYVKQDGDGFVAKNLASSSKKEEVILWLVVGPLVAVFHSVRLVLHCFFPFALVEPPGNRIFSKSQFHLAEL